MKLFKKENREAIDTCVLLFSTDQVGRTATANRISLKETERMLSESGISYKVGTALYRGTYNTTVMALPTDMKSRATVRNIVFNILHQDSMLIRANQHVRGVYKYNRDYEVAQVGDRFVSVSLAEATANGAYTEMNGKYFIVK